MKEDTRIDAIKCGLAVGCVIHPFTEFSIRCAERAANGERIDAEEAYMTYDAAKFAAKTKTTMVQISKLRQFIRFGTLRPSHVGILRDIISDIQFNNNKRGSISVHENLLNVCRVYIKNLSTPTLADVFQYHWK